MAGRAIDAVYVAGDGELGHLARVLHEESRLARVGRRHGPEKYVW